MKRFLTRENSGKTVGLLDEFVDGEGGNGGVLILTK